MSNDLVKRLRGWPAVIKAESVMLEAADRIEELDDIIQHDRERIVELVSMVNSKDDRIEKLEAKLAKAVEAGIAARSAQKAYFKDRSKDNLIASKQAEVNLDKMLAELKEEDRE